MRLPDKLSANTHEAARINLIIDYLRSLTPRPSATVDVSHTPFGVIHTALRNNLRRNWPPPIYDKTKYYLVGDWVWVRAADTICTAGVIDPLTGLTVKSLPGLWRCLQASGPVVTTPPGNAAGTYYRIPQTPYPTPDDPTAENMIWLLISPAVNC